MKLRVTGFRSLEKNTEQINIPKRRIIKTKTLVEKQPRFSLHWLGW
jgi:hypothetical protein